MFTYIFKKILYVKLNLFTKLFLKCYKNCIFHLLNKNFNLIIELINFKN